MMSEDQVIKPEEIRRGVRENYGKAAAQVLGTEQKNVAIKTSSCCGGEKNPAELLQIEEQAQEGCGCQPSTGQLDRVLQMYSAEGVDELPDEVTGVSLGCGDPVTLASLEPGQTVLDLGAGGGIDCFLAAKQVGESGYVIGVDMTPEMVELARANKERVGAPNVDFRLGEIEHLPAADNSVDVVISNCVINLSPDKPQVFRDAFRVLKPGGLLSVSDIVTDGPLPDSIRKNVAGWSGCLAGALDFKDYIAAIEAAGFTEVESPSKRSCKNEQDAVLAQLGVEATEGEKKLVVNLGAGANVISLSHEDAAQMPAAFSAKVRARKPRS